MIAAARTAGIRRLSKQKHTDQKPTISSCRGSDGSVGSPETPPPKTNLLRVPPISIRKRSGSVPAIRYTLASAWGLKPDQSRALRVTWSRLCESPRSNCKGIVAIMDHIFEKFDEKDKNVREIFYNTAFVDSMADRSARRHSNQSIATLHDHTHFFVSLISQVIQAIDSIPDEIFEHIDNIGIFHASLKQYGFKQTMWDKLGEQVIDALVVQDCVRGFPDACRAWTILIAALIDRLRAGRSNFSAGNLLLGVNASPRTCRRPSIGPCVVRTRAQTISPALSLHRHPSRASITSQKL
uniref:GLOBIN domain-containing protein n=1 Tax=Ascaris lumbricoides TaxID=6252 RepID=A0A0M3I0K5_ASCLU